MPNKKVSKIRVGDEKIALSLEGGGARGAYQIGAVKALFEHGYKFDAVVGTSIGAINGAYIAQNEFDKIYNMWESMSFKDLFDLDNDIMKRALLVDLDIDSIKYLSKKLGEAVKNKGLDTVRMREILNDGIDEEKLRNSPILYGLVTMCISDINGEEKFIHDIPEGKVVDYIMASSNLPVFKRSIIDNKKYLDGGAWDNCPVHMLEEKGYRKAIVIRAHKRIRIRDYKNILKRGNITLNMIEPIDTLPSILNFDSSNLKEEMKLGYYDALKYIQDLDGFRYYFNNLKEEDILTMLHRVNPLAIEKLAKLLRVRLVKGETIYETLIDKIIPLLVQKTKEKAEQSTKNAVIAIVEHILLKNQVERYKIYNFKDVITLSGAKQDTKDPLELFVSLLL
ncbi:MAG: patatin-like phospholipase family protein [Clostridia bacterium]|nr:patatin-like phospholipase family protein [Clostridia bacterium]